MSYTLGQAAKAVGRTKPTILRAIKSHKISAVKDEATGEWQIEPAELHRVYPPISQEEHEPEPKTEQGNNALQVEVTLLRERLADKDAMIDELREDRDQWREQAQRLAITDQRANPPAVMVTPPPAAPNGTGQQQTPAPAVSYDTAALKPPPTAERRGWFRRLKGR